MKFGVTFRYYNEVEQESLDEEFNIEASTKEKAFAKIYDAVGNYGEIEDMEVECVELGEIFNYDDVCGSVQKYEKPKNNSN